MVTVLEELNAVTTDSKGDFWPLDLPEFLKMFDREKMKHNYFPPCFLSSFTGTISERLRMIDVPVDSIFGIKKIFFDNKHDLCSFVPKFLIFVNTDERFPHEGIDEEYLKLLDNIAAQMTGGIQHRFCHKSTPLHQGMLDYFREVMTAYLKKSVMIYHLNVIHAGCTNENQKSWMKKYVKEIKNTYRMSINQTMAVLKNIKHSMFRCDPQFNTTDRQKTHLELERMMQTVIIREEDLTTDESCSHNCDLESIKPTINLDECADYRDCQYIEGSYEICEANPKSSRLYQWVVYEKGVFYGDNSTDLCVNNIVERYSKLSFTKFRWCDYCVCTCVKKPSKNRDVIAAISFRDQVSDMRKNLVVVGIRFIKKDQMIHIQIKEGKIRPRRFIDHGAWKETEKFFYDYSKKTLFVINDDETQSPLQLGIDYGLPEEIHFDDLVAPEGFVVTGVRFRFAGDSLGFPKKINGSIQLQIRVTPFDYFTGKLKDITQTKWIVPELKATRKELVLAEPDLPTKSSTNKLDSKTDQFVKFKASDLKKDVGQSTVPFFDAQETEEEHEAPLGGVGLIHRGQEGFGGFLAFRVFDLDLTNNFNGTYDH
ncbi:uncharacterized protein LOC141523924 [Cotesia typhae]